ncbi:MULTISPECIES: alpha/beta hydrolase family protein [unclassified Enterococcus]|uniref:alpha/beta hydrolase n=1 Tax=unclassified Enterococcus TaxID=2608891 RepID=UPI001557B8C7|nr:MULTISPECIES: alpha/beta hydrolase family protein [unclassified Enterococcus]MBS7578437.1 esterase family protein [Enterococcus sp. MMGLQ5-2]MBS7585668.1 esterase family protein [Enterococcus sp. MMGLQ5-1]NPD13527.1 esterase family protein [Enterococcus sp. MMGLQ5-1]NPD38269.1 esterase family protein [Enterococcus sp. MMGLQ5-2]
MAVSRMNFRSDVLGKGTAVNIYLPDNGLDSYPVIYLLHGLSDDCNAWLNATSLERYAGDYNFIIVMPQVELSYYTNMYSGERYWDYLTQELPEKIKQWYRISHLPEQTFAAGNSMGGYGAFKWGLQSPQCFKAVASLSGSLDLVRLWQRDPARDALFGRIFGSLENLEASRDNLFQLFSEDEEQKKSPYFLQICGVDDFLYQDNQTFRQLATDKFANYQYVEKSGTHDWLFWDQEIQFTLSYFAKLLT